MDMSKYLGDTPSNLNNDPACKHRKNYGMIGMFYGHTYHDIFHLFLHGNQSPTFADEHGSTMHLLKQHAHQIKPIHGHKMMSVHAPSAPKASDIIDKEKIQRE